MRWNKMIWMLCWVRYIACRFIQLESLIFTLSLNHPPQLKVPLKFKPSGWIETWLVKLFSCALWNIPFPLINSAHYIIHPVIWSAWMRSVKRLSWAWYLLSWFASVESCMVIHDTKCPYRDTGVIRTLKKPIKFWYPLVHDIKCPYWDQMF